MVITEESDVVVVEGCDSLRGTLLSSINKKNQKLTLPLFLRIAEYGVQFSTIEGVRNKNPGGGKKPVNVRRFAGHHCLLLNVY